MPPQLALRAVTPFAALRGVPPFRHTACAELHCFRSFSNFRKGPVSQYCAVAKTSTNWSSPGSAARTVRKAGAVGAGESYQFHPPALRALAAVGDRDS